MHRFVILRNGQLETYSEFKDIPESFDNLIDFDPYYPPGPHTDEQHEEIHQWSHKLRELAKRETK